MLGTTAETVSYVHERSGKESMFRIANQANRRLQERRLRMAELCATDEPDQTIVQLVQALKSTGTTVSTFDEEYGDASFSASSHRIGDGNKLDQSEVHSRHVVGNTCVDPVRSFRSNIKRNTNHILCRNGGRRWRQDFNNPDALLAPDRRRQLMLRLRRNEPRLARAQKENTNKPSKPAASGPARGTDMFLLHIDPTSSCCTKMPKNLPSSRHHHGDRAKRKPLVVSQCIQTDAPVDKLRDVDKDAAADTTIAQQPEKELVSQCVQTEPSSTVVQTVVEEATPPSHPKPSYRRPFLLVEEFDAAHADDSDTLLLRRSGSVQRGDLLRPDTERDVTVFEPVNTVRSRVHDESFPSQSQAPQYCAGLSELGGVVQIDGVGQVWKVAGGTSGGVVVDPQEQSPHEQIDGELADVHTDQQTYSPLAKLLPCEDDAKDTLKTADESVEESSQVEASRDEDETLEDLQQRQVHDDFVAIRQRLAKMQRRMKGLDLKADAIHDEFSDMNGIFLDVIDRHSRAMFAWNKVDRTMASVAEIAAHRYDSGLQRILSGSENIKSEDSNLHEGGGTTSTSTEKTIPTSHSNKTPEDTKHSGPGGEGEPPSSDGMSNSTLRVGMDSSPTTSAAVREKKHYYHYHNNFHDSPFFNSGRRHPLVVDDGENAVNAKQAMEDTALLTQQLENEMKSFVESNESDSSDVIETSSSVLSYHPPSPLPRRRADDGVEPRPAATLAPVESYDHRGNLIPSVAVVAPNTSHVDSS